MLYSEFIEATGAKETEYNYTVYKNLEALYMMNDTVSKEDVYKAAKSLIDNSPTPAELEAQKIKEEIKAEIESYNKSLDYEKEMLDYYKTLDQDEATKEAIAHKKRMIKYYKHEIMILKDRMRWF